MRRSLQQDLPEVVVTTAANSLAVHRATERGEMRPLARRVYTKNLVDPPEAIVRRHLWPLLAKLMPGALIADRTAWDMRPAEDGSVFVVSDHRRDIELPGHVFRPRKGARGPDAGEDRFVDGLAVSSRVRTLLDNLAPSRRRGEGVRRTMGREAVEARLDQVARTRGQAELNTIRDEAGRLAPVIGREAEFEELSGIIGALHGTHDAPLLTLSGRARGAGAPYDLDRIPLFDALYAELRMPPAARPAPPRDATARETQAFFEAYFSNFIEGTEFDVDEAAAIVFGNVIPPNRPADAHDILGTWRVVGNPVEMARVPRSPQELLDILRSRHVTLMEVRPDVGPGTFKTVRNKAGSTVFVTPELVEGTLAKGFEYYAGLPTAFAKAAFVLFLVSEVHPFTDGNGRVARMMMNAELVAAGEERIIIPTSSRTDYLTALRALSLNTVPTPLVRVLDALQRWVHEIPWAELGSTHRALQQRNAFVDPLAGGPFAAGFVDAATQQLGPATRA